MVVLGNNLGQEEYRVLLIDDDNAESQQCITALSEHYAVSHASGQDKAWDLLNNTPMPDIILLNTMLADSDTFLLCQKIKEAPYFRGIPVVFVCAKNDTAMQSKAFDIGAADYILRPLSFDALNARLNRHIQQYHQTKKLESLIYIDPLTHLPNAAKFQSVLAQEWSRCARYWHHLSLLLIRLDNFQGVKQEFGNDEYYAITASIADDLRSLGSRPGDLFASYAEDTFALLLCDCSLDGAQLKAKQILERFKHPHFMAKHEQSAANIRCTISLNVAAPAGGSSVAALIKSADNVLANCHDSSEHKICECTDILGIDSVASS